MLLSVRVPSASSLPMPCRFAMLRKTALRFAVLPNCRPFFYSPFSFASIAHATVFAQDIVSMPSSSSS